MNNLRITPLLAGLALVLSSCGQDSMMTNGDSGSSALAGSAGGGEFQLMQQLPEVHIGTANAATVIDQDRNFVNDSVYVLHGYVFIGDGDDSNNTPTLDIEEGTIIRGALDEASTLIVNDDATILAEGTASQPIVFTSNAAANSRQPGDWGGIVVLGEASTNQAEPLTIEGIPGSITNGTQLAQYGGSTDSDNSGILQYVRIEYAGTEIGEGDETNGLTLGAVGSGTTLDHIQVSYGLDDGFEFFGGTVNASYLIAYRNDDDSFDTDFGYRGKIQFAVDYRDPELVNSSGSKGFESNNEDEFAGSTPFTQGIWSNYTLIGPSRPEGGIVDPLYGSGVQLREGSALNLFNSVIIGYESAQLEISSVATEDHFTNQTLRLKNVTLAVPVGGNDLAATDGADLATVREVFETSAYANEIVEATSNSSRSSGYLPRVIGLPDAVWRLPNTDSDPALAEPVPQSGSPLIGSASFSDSRLSGFQSVSYRGAFGPSSSDNAGWNLGSGWISYTPLDNNYGN